MDPFKEMLGEEVEVIDLVSASEGEYDHGPPPPGDSDAAAPAQTPTEVVAHGAGGGDGSEEGGEVVDSAAQGPAPAPAGTPIVKSPRSVGRRPRGSKRKWGTVEKEEPEGGRPGPVLAGPSGAGPSRPASPAGALQRSLVEFYPLVRSPPAGTAPKPTPERAGAGPSAPPAAPVALVAPRFSAPAAEVAFEVLDDTLSGLMSEREGGGAAAVAEVLAALLRRFKSSVPLEAAIPQDLFGARWERLVEDLNDTVLTSPRVAAALAEATPGTEGLRREAAAEAARAGDLEQQLVAAKEELLEARAEARAAAKRAAALEAELAVARVAELRGKEEAERTRAAAASESCGVPTPSDAQAEGPRAADGEAGPSAAAAPPKPRPLSACHIPADVFTEAVYSLNYVAGMVRERVLGATHSLAEPPERLAARLAAAMRLIFAGKAVIVEPNVFAEGADAAARWPGFTYSPRSHWAGQEVPVLDASMARRLKKAGLKGMEAGQRAVLGGAVPYPLLATRSLIEGGKGWGLRTLAPIPAGSCVIAYHGEYMTQEEADEVGAAARGKAAKACFSFSLEASAPRAAARTPAQLATFKPGGGEAYGDLDSCVLDARRRGNASRFFNHSCVPNCTSREVDVPHGPTQTLQFALRDIAAGEELTLDYAEGWTPAAVAAALRAFQSGDDHQRCCCGHAKCRGWCF